MVVMQGRLDRARGEIKGEQCAFRLPRKRGVKTEMAGRVGGSAGFSKDSGGTYDREPEGKLLAQGQRRVTWEQERY